MPGRTADARPPSESEIRSTSVLALAIDEASAKVRVGGPIDDEPDLTLPVWAGLLPVVTTFGTAVPEPEIAEKVPAYLTGYRRP